MRFLVDAQLPPALARWIEAQGQTAEHVADLGMADANDRGIWDHAVSVDAVIITKDEDFATRRVASADGPNIVWVRKGNTTRRALLAWFAPLWPAVLEALERGEPLVEIV